MDMRDLSYAFSQFKALKGTDSLGRSFGYGRRKGKTGVVVISDDMDDDAANLVAEDMFHRGMGAPFAPGQEDPNHLSMDIRQVNLRVVSARATRIRRFEEAAFDQRVMIKGEDVPAGAEPIDQRISFADADEDQRRPDVDNFVLAA